MPMPDCGRGGIPIMEALPTSNLREGMEIRLLIPNGTAGSIYSDAADTVLWHLRYRSVDIGNANPDATYPWDFIGGPPLVKRDATVDTANTAGSPDMSWRLPGGFSTPILYVPRKGIYYVRLGARIDTASGTGVDNAIGVSVEVGGNTPSSDNAAFNHGTRYVSVAADARITVTSHAAANDRKLRMLYKIEKANETVKFDNKFLTVFPVRLG